MSIVQQGIARRIIRVAHRLIVTVPTRKDRKQFVVRQQVLNSRFGLDKARFGKRLHCLSLAIVSSRLILFGTRRVDWQIRLAVRWVVLLRDLSELLSFCDCLVERVWIDRRRRPKRTCRSIHDSSKGVSMTQAKRHKHSWNATVAEVLMILGVDYRLVEEQGPSPW